MRYRTTNGNGRLILNGTGGSAERSNFAHWVAEKQNVVGAIPGENTSDYDGAQTLREGAELRPKIVLRSVVLRALPGSFKFSPHVAPQPRPGLFQWCLPPEDT